MLEQDIARFYMAFQAHLPGGQVLEEAEEEAGVHGARHVEVRCHQGQVVGRQRVILLTGARGRCVHHVSRVYVESLYEMLINDASRRAIPFA